ncbi:DUF938 domain-containing protein [Qipengyuania sp. G39]|uniref:DUF938 domain-containing protein n=1 Tax=Qipengyuania profundimaris TaxID=3067652 RepID=A0ABT9HNJ0_9SPHN|nr:DUF938 domain-containing protein [Qipengyuania sp. G39]MDP4574681.1 DUF938 domain-containing protein [Qipengyuania sp. G39]
MKRYAPAAGRNVLPIGDVLAEELPESGLVLEIASGSGEHALAFARRFPALDWQPSDPDPEAIASIAAWREEDGPDNLRPPVILDASSEDWPVASAAAVLCINMVHISPWSATEGLMRQAAEVLDAGKPLILYGPFIEDDVETAPSNIAFDESLNTRNSAWGLRALPAVDRLARASGFDRTNRYPMPANNLTVVYRRQR